MKKVLKTVLILCLAMMVLLAMTSCGTADNSSEPASAVTEFFGGIANWFNELGDAIMRFWQSLLDWFRQLFGIKPDCEHVYDNNCDAICNECGETRDAQAHQWRDATCINPKTCKVCGTTEGAALGHSPAQDDGDCTTDVLCTVCGAVTTPARLEHIAHADDSDCTTSVNCTECGWLMKPAQEHNFNGDWKTDADGHWQMCQNIDCKVAGTKEAHNKGSDGKCTVCGYVVEVIDPHEHSYTVADYDDTHHYMRCACGAIDESTKVEHSAISDNDCTTDDNCTCGYTVTAAKDHVAGEDDGNCETPIRCVNCEQDAKTGATGHHDADHDYICDNAGCQITVGNPPEDENDGIDLPIDRN